MESSRWIDARPVRIDAMACCRSVRAFSMRCFAPASISGIVSMVYLKLGLSLTDDGADFFSRRHSHYIAMSVEIENDDRQFVVAAHRNRGGVHHTQRFGEHLRVPDVAIHDGIGVLHRVFVVDAIHLRGLGDDFGLNLPVSYT